MDQRENEKTGMVGKPVTLELKHIGMLSDLVARGVGKNASDVMRQALEDFYEAHTEPTPTAQPA